MFVELTNFTGVGTCSLTVCASGGKLELRSIINSVEFHPDPLALDEGLVLGFPLGGIGPYLCSQVPVCFCFFSCFCFCFCLLALFLFAFGSFLSPRTRFLKQTLSRKCGVVTGDLTASALWRGPPSAPPVAFLLAPPILAEEEEQA